MYATVSALKIFVVLIRPVCSMLFQESTHGEQLKQDLIQNIERNVGLDTIMRLRTSTGKCFVGRHINFL